MEYKLINNEEKSRFEVHVNGYVAFEDYKLFKGGISYIHTEVPKELAGKEVGSFIAKSVLDYAAEHNLKVKPFCPYIKAYIDRHPEYQANSMFHN
tara:strand:- start:4801 stop:5085 length:285 start_codon:yes stop_codon:yes gene_type:complete